MIHQLHSHLTFYLVDGEEPSTWFQIHGNHLPEFAHL